VKRFWYLNALSAHLSYIMRRIIISWKARKL